MAGRYGELRVSNDAMTDGAELRRRLAQEGYVFFRHLVDPGKMLGLRKDITTVLGGAGWFRAGTDPMDGIADVSRRCTEGDLPYSEVYQQVYKLRSFHAVPHHRELVDMVEALLGSRAMPLPGHKARIWFPKFVEHTTPLHQDFVHYQGSFQVLTCWTPVGDCPYELGPLAVLPGSHKVKKVLTHHFSLGAGGLIIDLEEERRAHAALGAEWLSADFEAGDVLFFPALTVHKALPNVTEDRMRVSLDNRYMAEGGQIADHMLQPHMSDLSGFTWEDVYRDWGDDDLKYYWLKRPHRKVPRYMGYMRRGFTEALDLARGRDKRAILALKRTVILHPETDDARAAKEVLEMIGEAV